MLLLSLALAPSILWAKAAYYLKADMVRMAEAIALVTITSVDTTDTKGNHWTYKQVATAKVERVLKGKLPSDVKLYGGEKIICGQCHFGEGKFLVFLRHDGDLLTCANWHLSIRPITGDTIEWYKNNESLELVSKPLRQVLDEVVSLVSGEQSARAEKGAAGQFKDKQD